MAEDKRTKWQKLADYLKPCELLPEDKAFVISYLPINRGYRKTVLIGYKEKWLLYMRMEPVEQKKQNVGRNGANTWLRTNYNVLRKEAKYG